ncbi:hypothetical protein BGP76_19445 [Reichenbachiella sp. MSK19-1]|nr:hypothetical protein BGP76_19445 [Reichenbachiella sp. MSK19-1]
MLFVLSKIVYWLIMPLSISMILLLSSWCVRNTKIKKRLFLLGIVSLLFFSNPLLSKWMINLWEPNPVLYTEITEHYDWAIVLAGITEPNRPPYDRVQFNKGADRIVHAIQLYKLGKVKKILISGGSGVVGYDGKKESHALAGFAQMCGVDSTAIFIEDQSRNTHENALYSTQQITTNETAILFTSAFHIRRAKGCFQKLGITADTFPTDYYGGEIHWTPDALFIPKTESIQTWSMLIKEWVGLGSYKLLGYI